MSTNFNVIFNHKIEIECRKKIIWTLIAHKTFGNAEEDKKKRFFID